MKQNNYFSFILGLIVMAVFASCSSTQYAAHFAPSTYDAHTQDKKEHPGEEALASQDKAPDAAIEDMAERSGAADVKSDAVPKAVNIRKLIKDAEMPDENEFTARQQEILAQTRERLQNMTREEKRALKRELRSVKLADYTKNLPSYENMGITDTQQVENKLLLIVITILIPPLGVFLHQGAINTKFWVSLLLTLLFYVPGLIYSLIVVLGS